MRIHMVPLGTFPTIRVTLYLLFRKELHISRLISIKITITIPQTWVVNLKRTYNVCCEGTLITTVCLLILILYGLSLKRIIIIFGHCSIFLYLFISLFHLHFIVHPDIKLSHIPVQSLGQDNDIFKVPLSLKTKYIYISASRWTYITNCIIHSMADLHRKPNSLLFLLPSHNKALQQALRESINGQKLK